MKLGEIEFQKCRRRGCFILFLKPRTLSLCSATEIRHSSKTIHLWSLFLSLYLPVPTGRLHKTSPGLAQSTTKFSGHFNTETRFLLAFPRRWALRWGETPAPWCGQATLGNLLEVQRPGCSCQGLTQGQAKYPHAPHTSTFCPQSKDLSIFQGCRVIAQHSSNGNHEDISAPDLNIQYPEEKDPPPQRASICKMISPSHAGVGWAWRKEGRAFPQQEHVQLFPLRWITKQGLWSKPLGMSIRPCLWNAALPCWLRATKCWRLEGTSTVCEACPAPHAGQVSRGPGTRSLHLSCLSRCSSWAGWLRQL